MAALHEKYLWPLIGVVIFAVLAAFYIDDRRRLAQEHTGTDESQQASTDTSATSKSSDYKSQKSTDSSRKNAANKTASAKSDTGHKGFSGSIDDYLAQSNQKRSKYLEAAVKEHQGFSGSIEDYLNSKQTKQASSTKQQTSGSASYAKSMGMDEYLASTEDKPSASGDKHTHHKHDKHRHNNNDAYNGSIDGYLAKFGDGKQTPISNSDKNPFNGKEHQGFHGSYEEYAKKYN